MDDDSAVILDENDSPLGALEAALAGVGETLTPLLPVEDGRPPLGEATPSGQRPGDGDHLPPGRREELERELAAATRVGNVQLAAQDQADLLGIGPFDPGAYGLSRTSTLGRSAVESEGGFGSFFEMNRDNRDNPDRLFIAKQYAATEARYRDGRKADDMSDFDNMAVESRYAEFVVHNRVGKYDLSDGNGHADWVKGGARLTVYTPDGDYGIGKPTPEAVQALRAAGYEQLPN